MISHIKESSPMESITYLTEFWRATKGNQANYFSESKLLKEHSKMIKLRMEYCNIQLELNIKVNLEMANDVILFTILGGHGKFTFPN
jgi:hypothetical protein